MQLLSAFEQPAQGLSITIREFIRGIRQRDTVDESLGVPCLGRVVVMLDGDLACGGLVDQFGDLIIYWGAQLGLPDEVLISGPLSEAIDQIRATRAAVRADRGWLMDIYLLRQLSPPGENQATGLAPRVTVAE